MEIFHNNESIKKEEKCAKLNFSSLQLIRNFRFHVFKRTIFYACKNKICSHFCGEGKNRIKKYAKTIPKFYA